MIFLASSSGKNLATGYGNIVNMKNYILGRTIVIWSTVISIVVTILFMTSLADQEIFFVAGNILQHLLAVIFFLGLGLALYGLVVKKEYQAYKFSFLDVLFIILVLLSIQDEWYTIVTPHPLLNEIYYI